MPTTRPLTALLACLLLGGCGSRSGVEAPAAQSWLLPGARTLVHAHNCYPQHGEWSDRLDRALATGLPIVIEQDLLWHADPETGEHRSIVAHNCPCDGSEPTLEEHFFARTESILEDALTANDPASWPVLILHLDFKTDEPEHLTAFWELLGKYERFLMTARRTEDPREIAPLEPGPLWVITEHSRAKETAFHGDVPAGSPLRVFGSLPDRPFPADMPAEERARLAVEIPVGELSAGLPDNYRRWWNLSWHAVEEGGALRAGEWTAANAERLEQLVNHAHAQGIFIRFYALNGHAPEDSQGWSQGYNFGSLEAAQIRWRAARDAGVDFLATDQYEELARTLAGP